MREIKKFEFLLEAATPIAHHSETIGNQAIAMRRKVRRREGGWAQVPSVSGDAMRHGLREAAAYAFLDAAGLLSESGRTNGLTESTLRLLFAGGMVSGRGDASVISLETYDELVDLVPPLALLGGCASGRIIPGRLTVDDAMLVCKETESSTPDWIREAAGELDSCRAHVEIAQRVRMDPTLDPAKRLMMSGSDRALVERRMGASERAHDSDDAIAREASKCSMLPRTHECIVQGSLFSWSVEAFCHSDLDVDTLHTMVGAFLANARVGGKRGTGHGLLRPVQARGVVVNRPSERMHVVDTKALAPRVGEMFRAHVAARRERIGALLQRVDA